MIAFPPPHLFDHPEPLSKTNKKIRKKTSPLSPASLKYVYSHLMAAIVFSLLSKVLTAVSFLLIRVFDGNNGLSLFLLNSRVSEYGFKP